MLWHKLKNCRIFTKQIKRGYVNAVKAIGLQNSKTYFDATFKQWSFHCRRCGTAERRATQEGCAKIKKKEIEDGENKEEEGQIEGKALGKEGVLGEGGVLGEAGKLGGGEVQGVGEVQKEDGTNKYSF